MKVLWFGSETDEVKVRRLMTTEAVARVLELAKFSRGPQLMAIEMEIFKIPIFNFQYLLLISIC